MTITTPLPTPRPSPLLPQQVDAALTGRFAGRFTPRDGDFFRALPGGNADQFPAIDAAILATGVPVFWMPWFQEARVYCIPAPSAAAFTRAGQSVPTLPAGDGTGWATYTTPDPEWRSRENWRQVGAAADHVGTRG